ncbi:DVUA0089 family protein [Dinoroseobacter sp. S76]|uniref:DVUA0089 family protein n=1 Tax=Dinoroseobacter sp. S76 TaxID=3415124 RepID=UPI003C7C1EE8
MTSLAALGLSLGAAQAASIGFSGQLADDSSVAIIEFTITANSNTVLRTVSYGGGMLPDGTVIDPGGFDPVLTVFQKSSGAYFGDRDDDASGTVIPDPITGQSYDAIFELDALTPAGSYYLVISQYPNRSLGDSFLGEFSVTDPFGTGAAYGCSNGQFCDTTGANRTSDWAVILENVERAVPFAPIPAPPALPLLASGMLGIWMLGRKRV